MTGKRWTIKEKNFLVEHRLDYSLAEMAARVGHPKSSVLDKIHDFGYTWRRKPQEQYEYWSLREEKFLKDNYGRIPTREIAQKLSRTLHSIRNKINVLNLWHQTQEEIGRAPEFNLTDIEASYIAGIIDGEGTLSTSLNFRKAYPGIGVNLSVSNTDLRLIKWLKAKLNTNQQYLQRRRVSHYKKTYSISIGQREHLQKVITRITPYLIVKKQIAKLFLEILELKRHGTLKRELLHAVLKFKELQDVRNKKIKASTEKLRKFIRSLQRGI